MYWRFADFPELQHLSDAERKHLLKQYTGRVYMIRFGIYCLSSGFFICLLGFGALSVLWQLLGSNASPPALSSFEIAVILTSSWLFVSAAWYQFLMIRTRGQLRIYLSSVRQQGEKLPLCLNCGYAVYQTTGRCPECGAEI